MASLRLKIIGLERNGFLIQRSREGGGTLCLLFYVVFSFMDVKTGAVAEVKPTPVTHNYDKPPSLALLHKLYSSSLLMFEDCFLLNLYHICNTYCIQKYALLFVKLTISFIWRNQSIWSLISHIDYFFIQLLIKHVGRRIDITDIFPIS